MEHPSVPVQPALSVEPSAHNGFVVHRGSREVWRGEALNEAHAVELAEQHETDRRVHRLSMRHRPDNPRDRATFADGAAYGRADLARRLRRALDDNDGPALAAAIDALCTAYEQPRD